MTYTIITEEGKLQEVTPEEAVDYVGAAVVELTYAAAEATYLQKAWMGEAGTIL